MTVARCHNGEIVELFSNAETVRLSADLERNGFLRADRIEAALSTLQQFARAARAAGATQLIGVGTEAIRIATNGAVFLEQVQQKIGIECRIISGSEEADLTFRGVAAHIDMHGLVLIADIGGGSTEVIAANNGVVTDSQSVSIGSGRLTDRYIASDPPDMAAIHTCRTTAYEFLATTWSRVSPKTDQRLIVVGGTGEFLMRLLPQQSFATAADIDTVLERLASLTAAELSTLIDIPVARARVLPAGIAIVAALADHTQPVRIETSRSGIRFGLLLDACSAENSDD